MSEGPFFWRDDFSPMETEDETMNLEKTAKIVQKVAEQLGIETADLAPYLDEWIDAMASATKAESVEDTESWDEAELVKAGIDEFMKILSPPETDDETTETEAEEPAEVELVEPEEVEPEEVDTELLKNGICIYLEGNPSTTKVLSNELEADKELVAHVCSLLEKDGLVTKEKGKKTWTLVGVDAESATPVEDELPTNEEPNTVLRHALGVEFNKITDLVLTAVQKAQEASSESNAYKTQAEQYTDVMSQLRAVFDRLQEGPEQFHLHNPVIQEFARIAEWHPEA